jgi:tRNA guanosine-2'-O-methyltransferase
MTMDMAKAGDSPTGISQEIFKTANEEKVLSDIIINRLSDAAVRGLENIDLEGLLNCPQIHPDDFWVSSPYLTESSQTQLYRCWSGCIAAHQDTRLALLMSRTMYWLLIQRGLCSTSPERIKMCLYILKHSMSLLKQGVNSSVLSFQAAKYSQAQQCIARYCSIFETIVLGRGVNQVEESLNLLPPSILETVESTQGFSLDCSWWIALFTAAISLKNASPVQKLVGNWILSHIPAHLDYSQCAARFLAHPFLRWCCQGNLFTTTIIRVDSKVECEHGSRLSSFLSDVIKNSANPETSSRYTTAVLEQLKSLQPNPHAVGFILQGLDIYSLSRKGNLQAFKAPSEPIISMNEISLSFRLFNRLSLSDVMRQICDYHIKFIMENTDIGATLKMPNISALIVSPETASFDLLKDIPGLLDFLENPGYLALQDNSLQYVCETILELVNKPPNDFIQSHSVHMDFLQILEKIWKAIQQQRHPKGVTDKLIDLLFQRAILEVGLINEQLRVVLANYVMALFRLAQSDIRIWNPLAKALRRAYFQIPKVFYLIPLRDILKAFARMPPAPSKGTLLDYALSQGLEDRIYGGDLIRIADEGYGHACIFDLMNRLKKCDFLIGKAIVTELMDPWFSIKPLSGAAATPRIPTIFQSALILAGRCFESYEDSKMFREQLLVAFTHGVNPTGRLLFEWMFTASYWKFPTQIDASGDELISLLEEALDEESYSKKTVSLLHIALSLANHQQTNHRFIQQLMCLIPTLCTSDRVAIRHEAQWAVPQIMEIAEDRAIQEITENTSYIKLNNYIRSLKYFKEPPEMWKMAEFDPQRDQNLKMLFEGPYLHFNHVIWNGPKAQDFTNLLEKSKENSFEMPEPYLHVGSEVQYTVPKATVASPKTPSVSSDSFLPLQSKSSLSLDPLYLGTDKALSSSRCSIILIATLIDSPYNLGGLSRVAEIYGAIELHVSDKSILKHNAFSTTSVHSEAHLNIVETPEVGLVQLLNLKKSEGWSIVGIEQTDSSIILSHESTKLPEKAVIVLGAEKTGMPVNILLACDFCVEIKQWGVTRSLNVQTAAATVLYEFRRQWDATNPGK